MKVFALVGKSGTGKSYQALYISKDRNIEYIIDDGLFIHGHMILAGESAKREKTKIRAVKTALFTDDEHQQAVVKAIEDSKPDKILIIGTSDRMIYKIVERLGLPQEVEIIWIDDITTEEERAIAKKQRHEHGKHVIPVPVFQLKQTFSGYFMDPLKLLRNVSFGKHEVVEKSEVRPTFSYLGNFEISTAALNDIVNIVVEKIEGIKEISKTIIHSDHSGVDFNLTIIGYYGGNIFDTAVDFQRKLSDECERITGMHVKKVNVQIKSLDKR